MRQALPTTAPNFATSLLDDPCVRAHNCTFSTRTAILYASDRRRECVLRAREQRGATDGHRHKHTVVTAPSPLRPCPPPSPSIQVSKCIQSKSSKCDSSVPPPPNQPPNQISFDRPPVPHARQVATRASLSQALSPAHFFVCFFSPSIWGGFTSTGELCAE